MKEFGIIDQGGVGSLSCVPTKITYQGRLRDEKARIESRLADINAVLETLDKSPEIANVIEAINRLNY